MPRGGAGGKPPEGFGIPPGGGGRLPGGGGGLGAMEPGG